MTVFLTQGWCNGNIFHFDWKDYRFKSYSLNKRETTMEDAVEYKCDTCKATGVKLWRMAATFTLYLLCGRCVCLDQKVTYNISGDGHVDSDYGVTDQIGSYVPAVLSDCGTTFYGYTSVPEVLVYWWRSLPLEMPAETAL